MTSRRPWPLTCLIVALLCGCTGATAFAAEPAGSPTVFDEEQSAANVEANASSDPLPSVFDTEARLATLEAKVAELDKTKVTAAQAREIAKEEIAKVTVALQSASGQIATKQVSVGSNYQGSFQLNPGETLLGYTDPVTGKYIDLSNQPQSQRAHQAYAQPVQHYNSPNVEFAMAPAPQGQPRRVAMRARPTMQRWISSGGGGCANGRCGF